MIYSHYNEKRDLLKQTHYASTVKLKYLQHLPTLYSFMVINKEVLVSNEILVWFKKFIKTFFQIFMRDPLQLKASNFN